MKYTEMECQRFDAEILRLQNKRARCASYMEKLHTAFAPCHRLPSEILAKIFMQCLDWHDPLGSCINIPIKKINGTWPRQQHQGLLPAPWILGYICSRWRQIALGEKHLWNSISFTGNRDHFEMLIEAFRRGGQSALQLEARGFPEQFIGREFFSIVVCPQSHRISSLILRICAATYRAFLLLPSGLFDKLLGVEPQVCQHWRGMCSTSTATVFQNAPRLRRATLPIM